MSELARQEKHTDGISPDVERLKKRLRHNLDENNAETGTHGETIIKCAGCGKGYAVKPGYTQQRINCVCGVVIDVPWSLRKMYNVSGYHCDECRDSGLVIFERQYKGNLYDTAARCTCPAGIKLPSTIGLISDWLGPNWKLKHKFSRHRR